MAELKLPLFQTEGIPQMVEIWGDRCEALAADKQAESWISDYWGKDAILFLCRITAIAR